MPSPGRLPVSVTGAGSVTIPAPADGRCIVVIGYALTLSSAGAITFATNAGGETMGSFDLPANGFIQQTDPKNFVMAGLPNANVTIANSAGNMKGYVNYTVK